MVDISQETIEQTDARLLAVTKQARLLAYSGSYAFLEFPLADFPAAVRADALALVRDDAVWSQLVPCEDAGEDLFAVFRFHFPDRIDNSGFVGWLASRLKRKFGTGVFVTCGQNRRDGGIFDYWGVPLAVAAETAAELDALVSS
ncbi:DUF6196 family protein [Lysobacter sp. 1R34A]|uniref:DUF6196 family protein n=1 Tax=Lysobacter sp. 1R34A TaxID=3445786 RepID=UPI003EEF0281